MAAVKLARSQAHGQARRGVARGDPGYDGPLSAGDLLASKYRVERILGEGGMGVVVAAYHELLDQRVAVKLLYGDVADREAQSRLLLEARSAAKLKSDHVARVIDVDVGEDGLPFIVMELLDGADLCQITDARGALPRWLVVDYILQALEGLAHAHVRGIIHRDLKPSNLFLSNRTDGSQIIKILDFGISKSQDQTPDRRAAQLTGGRAVLGSPPYMSPEQVRSPKTVDHRTDIWSLGICMYELLTNSMPFGGGEVQETFAQILEREPTPIRAIVNGVPEGLERVVMRCLAKNRDERFFDVGELARALAPYGSGSWIQAADRVAATLARPVLDDTTSGLRLKGNSERVAIPSSPGRRDSLQPELTGTTSTVARGFDSQKRWIVATCAGFALAGLLLIAFAGVKYRRAHAAAAELQAAATTSDGVPQGALPPTEAVPTAEPIPGAANAVVSGAATASPENELPGTAVPAGTVIGASPVTLPPSDSDSASSSVASNRTSSNGSASARRVDARPPGKPTLRKPPVPSTKPALPPGLPQTRSGQ